MNNQPPRFSHEKLIVYQKAIAFVAWAHGVIEGLPVKVAVRDQLDRASTSIPLNIAEGNVKASERDRARYWQISMGSTVECAAALDVCVARELIELRICDQGKDQLAEICRMLAKLLIKLGTRVSEDEEEYVVAGCGGG